MRLFCEIPVLWLYYKAGRNRLLSSLGGLYSGYLLALLCHGSLRFLHEEQRCWEIISVEWKWTEPQGVLGVAYVKIEPNTHVCKYHRTRIGAGDRYVSNISSNSSMFLNEHGAKLILVLLPGHSEPRMVLLSQEVSSISSACRHLHTFSQVADTCWASWSSSACESQRFLTAKLHTNSIACSIPTSDLLYLSLYMPQQNPGPTLSQCTRK